MFPDMPAEVFDAWLAPLIKSDGWPFFSEFSFASGLWAQYFDGHSIQSIKRLTWKRDKPICSIHSFSPDSKSIVRAIINTHVYGAETIYAHIKNGHGRESFLRSRDFIQRTGRIYAPMILIKDLFGFQIIDGHHRAAALFSVTNPIFNFDAWIGASPR